jgi:hypothetical protein
MRGWAEAMGVPVEIRADDHFICSTDEFARWAGEWVAAAATTWPEERPQGLPARRQSGPFGPGRGRSYCGCPAAARFFWQM